MSNERARLGQWASALAVGEVPPELRRLARLQHVAAATCPVVDGQLVGGDPFVLAARTSRSALPWLWRNPPRTVGELTAATVAANEIGGRVGLSHLLGPRALRSDGDAADAARAAAEARCGGASALPEGPDAPVPLPGALAGLGSVWLTRTLVVPRFVADPWSTVVLEAVDEILQRHVKAAEKRLRADQVERIEIRLPWLVWGREQAGVGTLAHDVGLLISFHALGVAERADPAARAEEVAWVQGTVVVAHDWALSLRVVEASGRGLGPLVGGFGWSDYRAVRGATKAGGGWPGWTAADLVTLARAHPERAWGALRGARGDLGAVDLSRFTWTLPVEIKLYTSRGGWWPERRATPVGTGAGLEAVVRARAPERVDAALALPDDAPAAELIGLLGVP